MLYISLLANLIDLIIGNRSCTLYMHLNGGGFMCSLHFLLLHASANFNVQSLKISEPLGKCDLVVFGICK